MKISSNLGTTSSLNKTNNTLLKTLNQLSTGKKINSASDDPAAVALVGRLESSTRSLSQTNSGISLAKGALSTAQGGLSSITDGLQRLRELAMQSSNGTLSDNDRANLQQEYDQVLSQIDSVAQNTSFGENQLLNGSFSGSVSTGEGSTLDLSINSVSSSALGVGSTGISSQSSAQDALEAIDSAISQVNSEASRIGARQNTLEYAENVNSVTLENQLEAKSQAGDLDYADAVAKLSAQQIQQEAQILALKSGQESQANILKKLLGG